MPHVYEIKYEKVGEVTKQFFKQTNKTTHITGKWLITGVQRHVGFQIRFPHKQLVAYRTRIFAFHIAHVMRSFVYDAQCVRNEFLFTLCAAEWLQAQMSIFMIDQCRFGFQGQTACGTLKRIVCGCVRFHVTGQIAFDLKAFAADFARIFVLTGVLCLVFD